MQLNEGAGSQGCALRTYAMRAGDCAAQVLGGKKDNGCSAAAPSTKQNPQSAPLFTYWSAEGMVICSALMHDDRRPAKVGYGYARRWEEFSTNTQ